jgi:FHA domain
MSENQKKSARTFQCRDALWEKFTELAQDLECSVDYLVNDAMKQYARQRGVNPGPSTGSSTGAPPPSSTAASMGPVSARAAASPKPAPLPAVPAAGPAVSAVPLPPLPSRAPARSPLPALPGQAEGRSNAPVPPPPFPPGMGPTPSRAPAPPPPVGARPAAPPPPRPGKNAGGPTLTVYYQGTAYPVTKDHFVIGRGKQGADLTIRDPNISRHHAAIEFSGGAFWMVDMNSTNGVEFNGQRTTRRQIHNGEVYRICSHELLMSLS